MVRFLLLRHDKQDDRTVGMLVSNGRFWGYTLEDAVRTEKIPGKTAIPYGDYEIRLRASGGMHERYRKRFPEFHRGMLWLQDVPGFTWVYVHIGNTPQDTEGCILIGRGVDGGGNLIHSALAYEPFYRHVVGLLDRGETVTLSVRDLHYLLEDYHEIFTSLG